MEKIKNKTFNSFTPANIKSIISSLPQNQADELTEFISKLLIKKSIFCGHCGYLLSCSGPCDNKSWVYGCLCGQICYHCQKGDYDDSPCPKNSTQSEIDEYWSKK